MARGLSAASVAAVAAAAWDMMPPPPPCSSSSSSTAANAIAGSASAASANAASEDDGSSPGKGSGGSKSKLRTKRPVGATDLKLVSLAGQAPGACVQHGAFTALSSAHLPNMGCLSARYDAVQCLSASGVMSFLGALETPRELQEFASQVMASDGLGWPRMASDGLGWPLSASECL